MSEAEQRSDTDYCRDLVMRYDPDRFRTVLFAPGPARGDLFVLYAFNLEIARIREAVSEPMLGAIRLQWWRETLAAAGRGEVRRHAVAAPLTELISRHGLPHVFFERLIDARARDMEETGFESLTTMTVYAEETAGLPLALALAILGSRGEASEQAARHIGAAWALTGLLRALPYRLRQGRETLPGDLRAAHGVADRVLRAFRADDAVRAAVKDVVEAATTRLAEARVAIRDLPAGARSPFLLIPLAEIYLNHLRRADFDPFVPDVAAPVPFATARMALWRLLGRV